MGIFKYLTDRQERRHERKEHRQEQRTTRALNRQNQRGASRQTAYNNGIDPNEAMWNGISDTSGNLANAFMATQNPLAALNGMMSTPETGPDGAPNGAPDGGGGGFFKNPVFLLIAAVVLFFILKMK